jgi:hypothetical protein
MMAFVTGGVPRTARGPVDVPDPQLTALFTSAPIRASSAAVSSVRAKAVGHIEPSLSFALG